MQRLQRITTEFIELEDRLRLTGITDDGKTRTFWLTQRLLQRLLLPCVNWLEERSPDLAKTVTKTRSSEIAQSIAQQAAQQNLEAESAVMAEVGTSEFLVQELEIKLGANGIVLIIKGKEQDYSLHLNNTQLRQWLGIVHTLWHKASWPLSCWPNWMATEKQKTATPIEPIH